MEKRNLAAEVISQKKKPREQKSPPMKRKKAKEIRNEKKKENFQSRFRFVGTKRITLVENFFENVSDRVALPGFQFDFDDSLQ